MKRKLVYMVMAVGLILPASGGAAAADGDAEAMLKDFVEDFRSDPFAAKAITFGVRIKDAVPTDWHVVVSGKKPGEEWGVTLLQGFPEERALFFLTDLATLAKVHDGEMSSLTAMGKTNSSDFAPLDIEAVPGVKVTPDLMQHVSKLSFHFWTRGFPEVVRFGDKSESRVLHGANEVLFYRQEGFSSGWFQIEKGQHINEDEADQINPLPSMMVIIRGVLKSRIGGKDVTLNAGETVYVGSGVSHEFWNDEEEPAEAVLLMFGEGA